MTTPLELAVRLACLSAAYFLGVLTGVWAGTRAVQRAWAAHERRHGRGWPPIPRPIPPPPGPPPPPTNTVIRC